MHTKRIVLLLLVGLMVTASAFAQLGSSGSDDSRNSRARSYELTITSNVRGAEIYIDGTRQRVTTPATIALRPGGHTVRVEARGYEAFERRIELTSDMTIRADLLPPTATVILAIPQEFLNDRVRDPWSMIDLYIDGRLRNEARVEVDPGSYDVTIVSGGLSITTEFFFEAGRTYTIDLLLRTGVSQGGR